MNERKRSSARTSELLRPPAFPVPGNKIFERIGSAVSACRGYPIQNKDFAKLIGRSKSTTSHWFGVSPQPHLVSCFCLLEQLPPPERHRAIDALCRELPLLEHPRLVHDPVTTASLRNLLTLDTGLTLIVGGTDEQRTFLLTALGHAYCRIDRCHRTAAGIDLHEPDWFVPLEAVLYLKGPANAPQTGELVRRTWPEILRTDKPLVLLNGIWSALPDLHNEILDLATRRHVIVADHQVSIQRPNKEPWQPVNVLSVSMARANSEWIAVRTVIAPK